MKTEDEKHSTKGNVWAKARGWDTQGIKDAASRARPGQAECQQSVCVSSEGLSRWPSPWQPPLWFPQTVNVTSDIWPMLLLRFAMRITTLILYSWTPIQQPEVNPTGLGHRDTGAIHLPRDTTRSPKRSNQGRKRGRGAGWSLTAGIVATAPDWTHICHVLLSVCGIGAYARCRANAPTTHPHSVNQSAIIFPIPGRE